MNAARGTITTRVWLAGMWRNLNAAHDALHFARMFLTGHQVTLPDLDRLDRAAADAQDQLRRLRARLRVIRAATR